MDTPQVYVTADHVFIRWAGASGDGWTTVAKRGPKFTGWTARVGVGAVEMAARESHEQSVR